MDFGRDVEGSVAQTNAVRMLNASAEEPQNSEKGFLQSVGLST